MEKKILLLVLILVMFNFAANYLFFFYLRDKEAKTIKIHKEIMVKDSLNSVKERKIREDIDLKLSYITKDLNAINSTVQALEAKNKKLTSNYKRNKVVLPKY